MRLRQVPDRPRRAVGYVRVSMAREEMVSPELQRAAIESYCEQRGYLLDDVIEELDASGRSFARKGVIEAIERVERNDADVVVVWKVSRFGRTRKDWYVHADRVEVAGGSLESATEQFDPLTSTGRLTRGMLVELAAWESDVKSEQWKEAHDHRFRQGLPHSPTRRFGYVYDPDRKLHVIDPETGPVLAECYRRYIAGDTPWAICTWLNDRGYRTTTGAAWTQGTLRKVLAKGFGAGYLYRRGRAELQPGAHEPVIDPATWAAYLRRRAKAAKTPARARAGTHPLTGLVVCARDGCGKTMNTWRGNQDGRVYEAYKCYRGCGRNYVGLAKLHDAVKDWLAAEVAADLDSAAATKAQQLAKRVIVKSDRAEIARQIREADKALLRLTDGWARGITPESAYQAASAALVAEKQGLEARLLELDDRTDALRTNVRPVARSLLRDYDRLLAGDPAGMREVLHRLIREISVRPGRVEDKVTVIPLWA